MDPLEHSLVQRTRESRESLQSMQMGFQRVLTPVCGIHSLPVELMQEILDEAIKAECRYDGRGGITIGAHNRALELTHVCSRWSQILSPCLWTNVEFSLATIKECTAREMWSVLALRTRQSPATIRIQQADSSRLTLAVCRLKDMESIGRLALHVGGSSSVFNFLKRDYTNLECRCRVVELYSDFREPSSHVDLDIALHHFRGVEVVVIDGLGDVRLGVPPPKLSSLTEIALKDLGQVPVIDIIKETSALCNLLCVRVDIIWQRPTQRFESGLKRLALIAIQDYDWIFHVGFPALEVVEFMQAPSMSFSPFIGTLRKLKSLNCDIKHENTILEINQISHQLERLVVHAADIVMPIYNPSAYGLAEPAFPNLSILELRLEKLSEVSLDGLIRGRCLPRSHLDPLLPKETSRITTLTLYWKDSPGESIRTTVCSREYLAFAKRPVEERVDTYEGAYKRLNLEWMEEEEPVKPPDYNKWLSDIRMPASKFYRADRE